MIKVISFDLDGTLSDTRFDELIWRTEIPRAYAAEKGVSFAEAFQRVTAEYKALWGKAAGNWRDATFWLAHFGLTATWDDLAEGARREIRTYPEVHAVLGELAKDHTLIVVSNAERKFMAAKMENGSLAVFFLRTYSASSDFHKPAKDEEVFARILKDLSIRADEMVHIGDNAALDVAVPRSLGITAFLLSRNPSQPGDCANLVEFREKVRALSASVSQDNHPAL